jgi:hemoglobin-like flavoprotein
MYKRTNPAVIRAIYREMSKDELKAELNVIFEHARTETKANRKQMLKSLYQYAQSLILSR